MLELKPNQVLLLALNETAIKGVHENHIEYDESKISNPAVKKLITYIASTVNHIIEEIYDAIISHEYIIFGKNNMHERSGAIFFIDSQERSKNIENIENIIKESQNLIAYIIQSLLPHQDLWQDQPTSLILDQDILDSITIRQEEFLKKWNKAKIHDGFSLFKSIDSDPFLIINSDFIAPTQAKSESMKVELSGIVDGFSYSQNEAHIKTLEEQKILKIKIIHPEHFTTLIEAAYGKKALKMTATQLKDTDNKKSTYTLSSVIIDEKPLSFENFELKPS
ncbi:hypothetical protein ACU6TU_03015 [Halomonas sp. LS-001]